MAETQWALLGWLDDPHHIHHMEKQWMDRFEKNPIRVIMIASPHSHE